MTKNTTNKPKISLITIAISAAILSIGTIFRHNEWRGAEALFLAGSAFTFGYLAVTPFIDNRLKKFMIILTPLPIIWGGVLHFVLGEGQNGLLVFGAITLITILFSMLNLQKKLEAQKKG